MPGGNKMKRKILEKEVQKQVSISQIVDKYVELDFTIKGLEKEKKEVKKELEELPAGKVEGENYDIVISESSMIKYDTLRIYEYLRNTIGTERAMECFKVTVEKVSEYIPEAKLKSFQVEEKVSKRFTAKKKEK